MFLLITLKSCLLSASQPVYAYEKKAEVLLHKINRYKNKNDG